MPHEYRFELAHIEKKELGENSIQGNKRLSFSTIVYSSLQQLYTLAKVRLCDILFSHQDKRHYGE